MPDAYFSKGDLTNLFTTAFDRNMRHALRSRPMFRQIADTRPQNQTNPGSSVVFTFYPAMALAKTPLDEVTDPAAAAISNPSRVTVNLAEYGNYKVETILYRTFTIDPKSVTNTSKILSDNLVDTLDSLVQDKLAAGTQHLAVVDGALSTSAAASAIDYNDIFTAAAARYAVTKLRAASVVPARGELYQVTIHPEVALDLRTETGAANWRDANTYVNTSGIAAGETGIFEGAYYVENPRCAKADDGEDDALVYNTYVNGREALAEAVAIEPHTVMDGTVVDPLNRKFTVGWHGILGWELFRPESLWVIRSAASINPAPTS